MRQLLVDGQGLVVWEAVYEAFGEARVDVELVESNLRFAGQYFDQETGLHYNWWRFYNPGLGRYFRSDPIGLDGYVEGNPTNNFDETGLVCGTGVCVAVGVCAANYTACAAAIAAAAGIVLGAVNNDSAMTPDKPYTGARQKEYEPMKKQCDKKPRKTGNKCTDLSREIDHQQNCLKC